jgi:hypothetical protein
VHPLSLAEQFHGMEGARDIDIDHRLNEVIDGLRGFESARVA